MTKPLLIYGLQSLANASFEADAAGVEPPTGWDASAGVNGRNQVSTSAAHSAGDGLPSANGLLQNTTSGTTGNKAVLRQRIDVQTLPSWVKTVDGALPTVEMVVAAVFRPVGPKADANAFLDVEQYSGSATTTPGSGTLYATPIVRRMAFGGPDWSLRLFAFGLYDQAKYVDVRLVYDIARAGFDAGANAHWDRVQLGFLCDLDRGFREFALKSDSGCEANEGNGSFELVKVRKPRTQIDIDIVNVMDGSGDDLQLRNLVRWLDGDAPGALALWQDRDEITNAGRHFQRCYRDPSLEVRYPPGLTRRNYSLRLVAPSEGVA